MKELLKQYDNYALSISATTRKPRPGEKRAGNISSKRWKNLKNDCER